MWLTKLERLADPKYGLNVRFESGWKRRGASGGAQMKNVSGVLWHHDVAPRSGTYPLRTMLRNGRAGLSGPLCHIGFDRDGTVWVVGAGKANHAGTGKVPGVVRNGGNTRLIGVEMTSAGTKPWDWTAAQLRQMPKLGAALSDIFGLSTSQHWAHYEYQDGKIDPAGLPGAMPGLRSRIAAVRFVGGVSGGGTSVPRPSAPAADPARPWTTSPRVQGMSTAEVKRIQGVLLGFDLDLGKWGADGSYGDATGNAVKQLQTELDLTADGVWGPATQEAYMTIKSDIDYIKRIAIENQKRIGEIPRHVLDAPVILDGIDKGKKSNLRKKIQWQHNDYRNTLAQIAGAQAAVLQAVQATGKAQGLTDDQVQAVASAAAEAAAKVSAEDVAGQLEVAVSKGD